MRIAVVIPFRGNANILQWVMEGFAQQTLPQVEGQIATLEVRVCGDGVEVPAVPADSPQIRFLTTSAPRSGVAEAKNVLLRGRPADVVIFGNSDTRPAPGFVAAHVARLMSLPENHLVLGSAPYERPANPSVFDELIERTPMVFFYNQMQAHTLYDFRHCWTLNLSGRYADLERIGFFDSRFRPYGYEDLDLGYRLFGAAKGIYFEPAAQVVHRHPMTFEDYLQREELLGLMTVILQDVNPDLFAALNGTRDVMALAEKYRQWTDMDRPMHGWIYRRMQEWNSRPANVLGAGESRERQLMTLYQMHIPLKRLAFRLGFLRGLELRDDSRWMERTAAGLWKKAIES